MQALINPHSHPAKHLQALPRFCVKTLAMIAQPFDICAHDGSLDFEYSFEKVCITFSKVSQ
jgi:hypothetical protein